MSDLENDDYSCDAKSLDMSHDEQNNLSEYNQNSQQEIKALSLSETKSNPSIQQFGLLQSFSQVQCQPKQLDQCQQALIPTASTTRITLPYLTKYEKAALIGKRAEQISHNSPIYVEISTEELITMTAIDIAQKELEMNHMPMIIRRFLPDGTYEDWKVKELKRFQY